MESEVSRILNSSLSSEIQQSIQANEQEISQMETLLRQKNSHINQLQDLIQRELATTLRENDVLRRAVEVYRREGARTKRELLGLGRSVSNLAAMLADGLTSIRTQLAHEPKRINIGVGEAKGVEAITLGTQSLSLLKSERGCQTEGRSEALDAQLLDRISSLEASLLTLKE